MSHKKAINVSPSTAKDSSKTLSSDIRVGELYWKQDGSINWMLGQLIAVDLPKQTASFRLVNELTGEIVQESQSPVQEDVNLQEVRLLPANPLFSTAADMTHLRHLNEAAIAKNLEDRCLLQNQRPYTFMANVLIAVNPLKPLENPDKHLFIAQPLDQCPPHPYHIAECAYRQLCAIRAVMQNQSIIISGESGSGKTETSKIILDFLTTRAIRRSHGLSTASEDEFDSELTNNSLNCSSSSLHLALSYPISSRSSRGIEINGKPTSSATLGERLMETIPILESFGNAKTHWNHNSSRFGKYMRLQFSTTTHALNGALIETYLLEKSRLVNQPLGERNFHIFYELLASEEKHFLKEELHLTPNDPTKYSYLSQSIGQSVGKRALAESTYHQINDTENFRNLCKALLFVGIGDDVQQELFSIVAGLLHLGNVSFIEQETSEGVVSGIDTDNEQVVTSLANAADLLGVQAEELRDCMLMKRIATRGARRGSIYYVKRDVRTALYSRDTISKTIYEHVFNWLMVQCAQALDYDSARADVTPYIGVLDVFGFEDFEPKNRNSFEQLLINYANEALQSLFNTCIFEAEQDLYRKEHIYAPSNLTLTFPFPLPTGSDKPSRNSLLSATESDDNLLRPPTYSLTPEQNVIQYSNNSECLDLIASRHGGIFVTIDNVSRLPCPSDRKLNERLHTLFKRHPCFPTPHPRDLRFTFMIQHYAGTVTYHVDSFVDKNNNIISEQFEEVIRKSSCQILIEMTDRHRNQLSPRSGVSSLETESTANGVGHSDEKRRNSEMSSSKRLKGGSVSNIFSKQMKGLITELEGTSCNFVRCIKPNTQMKPGVFEKSFVVEQLRCSGTVQACEVLRVGLSTRILYAEIVDVYKNVLTTSILQQFESNERLFTQAMLWVYKVPNSAYRLGDTRLFLRTGKLDLLDQLLSPSLDSLDSKNIETQMLFYLHRKRWISLVTKVIVYNHFERIYISCKFRRKAVLIQSVARRWLAWRRIARLKKAVRAHQHWKRFLDKARIVHKFQDLPEEKMVLLNRLLKKPYLQHRQKWLLQWLGPLERVLYMQRRWKKLFLQYSARRGFVWVLNRVRRRQSILKIQLCFRCHVARKRVRKLRIARSVQRHWRVLFLKLRIARFFIRILERVHVRRLEEENEKLREEKLASCQEISALRKQIEKMKELYEEMEVECERGEYDIAAQQSQLDRLNAKLNAAQRELTALKSQRNTNETAPSYWERLVQFLTCSALSFESTNYNPLYIDSKLRDPRTNYSIRPNSPVLLHQRDGSSSSGQLTEESHARPPLMRRKSENQKRCHSEEESDKCACACHSFDARDGSHHRVISSLIKSDCGKHRPPRSYLRYSVS
uniref:Myosinlike protein putative n=1 Tax=Albugo laibachii Nc14 TaxID=890382 RepID=F0W216_9STRA|nr:myosinlike protein putative [Albugo laibachii Nc14]|eukprot:CCA15095.1 myosinlike protein putative [Albugo laibachii Nc14]